MAIMQILGIATLVAVLAIGVVFAPQVFAQAESSYNMTNSPYNETAVAARNIVILNLTIWEFVAIMLAIAALVIAMLFIIGR